MISCYGEPITDGDWQEMVGLVVSIKTSLQVTHALYPRLEAVHHMVQIQRKPVLRDKQIRYRANDNIIEMLQAVACDYQEKKKKKKKKKKEEMLSCH